MVVQFVQYEMSINFKTLIIVHFRPVISDRLLNGWQLFSNGWLLLSVPAVNIAFKRDFIHLTDGCAVG